MADVAVRRERGDHGRQGRHQAAAAQDPHRVEPALHAVPPH